MKLRDALALGLGATALTAPALHAAPLVTPPGAAPLVIPIGPAAPVERPGSFDEPRAAYRVLYRAAAGDPSFGPGRNIVRHGLADGRPAPLPLVRRSNRIMWRVLHPSAGLRGAFPSEHLREIAMCESGGDPTAVSAGGTYRGLYQFDLRTWQSVGGSGDPAAASPAEQGRRAAILYARRGPAPWPVCG